MGVTGLSRFQWMSGFPMSYVVSFTPSHPHAHLRRPLLIVPAPVCILRCCNLALICLVLFYLLYFYSYFQPRVVWRKRIGRCTSGKCPSINIFNMRRAEVPGLERGSNHGEPIPLTLVSRCGSVCPLPPSRGVCVIFYLLSRCMRPGGPWQRW